ncbi:MAG: metallophosphoesterase [Bacteroidaceae bacterium]|nr:metallophosphoesterase [Bacteroidaceae bacterium]
MRALPLLIIPIAAIAYVAWHLWNVLPIANTWKCAVIALGTACVLSLILDVSGALDHMPMWAARALYAVGTSSLIIMLYIIMTLAVLDVLRLCHVIPQQWFYASWKSLAIFCAFISAIFLYGNIHYYNKERVAVSATTHKTLAKKTYKMVMASDLHLGYHNTRSDLAKWIDIINAEQPDIVLLAGDVIDMSVHPLIAENMAEEFRRLKAPAYACLGNHEYFSGLDAAKQFYKEAGIHLLIDEAAEVDSTLVIVGRDDRTNRHRKPLSHIMQGIDKRKYIVMLEHRPYGLYKAEKNNIDFQFSGHTHRGQVFPISLITDYIYECSWGTHQRGDTHYYVSTGMGIWGGKFRIGTQSEYVVATITAE